MKPLTEKGRFLPEYNDRKSDAQEDIAFSDCHSDDGESARKDASSKIVSIGPDEAGLRIDVALLRMFPEESRSSIQRLIKEGRVKIRGRVAKAGLRAEEGWEVSLNIPPPRKDKAEPEDIPLDILYEDDYLIAVNKPAGMASHPAPGTPSGTLVNALLSHCTCLSGIGGVLRPGIVHRLDKGTSGIMVVTKDDRTHRNLASQFKSHQVTKQYLALVWDNIIEEEGTIDLPVGRDRRDRKKMSIKTDKPREASTFFRVKKRFGQFTLLEVFPQTGRTHQIRVHLSQIKHPIVGDDVYGRSRGRIRLPHAWQKKISSVRRPLLHACKISFIHPHDGRKMEITAPVPADMIAFVEDAF